MCKVSDKIKFCTCVDEDTDIYSCKHYWILHRFKKDKDLTLIMGMPELPSFHPDFECNQDTLLKALNSPDAFDKKIDFKRWDRLEVVLFAQATKLGAPLHFNFRYDSKVWQHIEEDRYTLLSSCEEIANGEIEEQG